jgi:hypothetical protein
MRSSNEQYKIGRPTVDHTAEIGLPLDSKKVRKPVDFLAGVMVAGEGFEPPTLGL